MRSRPSTAQVPKRPSVLAPPWGNFEERQSVVESRGTSVSGTVSKSALQYEARSRLPERPDTAYRRGVPSLPSEVGDTERHFTMQQQSVEFVECRS